MSASLRFTIPSKMNPMPVAPTSSTPERVSKLLAAKGLCSRREAAAFIKRGWVLLDGRPVTETGAKAFPGQDIRLAKPAEREQEHTVTIILNKPPGFSVGAPEAGYPDANTLIRPPNQMRLPGEPGLTGAHIRGLAPAGRLDLSTRGLMVYTQDGRVARRLLGHGPEAETKPIEKESLIRVEGGLSRGAFNRLRAGVAMDGRLVKPMVLEWVNADQIRLVINETGHRQVWRLFEAVRAHVTGVKRVRIGGVKLGGLPSGKWRFLRHGEHF